MFLLAYLIGLIITIPIYPFRKTIRKYKILYPFWLFLNDTNRVGDRDAGDYGRFKHNFFGYYMQCSIRNSHWNLKLLIKPKQGVKYNIVGSLTMYNVDEPYIFGVQNCTYKSRGSKYFRYSFTRKIFFGKFIQNMQLGTNTSGLRYLFKHRLRRA